MPTSLDHLAGRLLRISDRYDHEVISLAIFADDDPGWRPDRYEYTRWGFRSLTEFPVVKLLDFAPRAID